MAEARDDLLRHYHELRAALIAAIDGVPDDELTAPTLDGWSVKDHLAHVTFWDELRADEIARISAGYEPAWRITHERSDMLNAVAHEARAGLSLAQVRSELAASGRRVLDAIAASTERGLDGSLYGEAGLRSTHEAEHIEWIRRWRGERGL